MVLPQWRDAHAAQFLAQALGHRGPPAALAAAYRCALISAEGRYVAYWLGEGGDTLLLDRVGRRWCVFADAAPEALADGRLQLWDGWQKRFDPLTLADVRWLDLAAAALPWRPYPPHHPALPPAPA